MEDYETPTGSNIADGNLLLLFLLFPFDFILIRRNFMLEEYSPVGIWCQNDVVSTSMRRDHVASTLIRRHFHTICPLGSSPVQLPWIKAVDDSS